MLPSSPAEHGEAWLSLSHSRSVHPWSLDRRTATKPQLRAIAAEEALRPGLPLLLLLHRAWWPSADARVPRGGDKALRSCRWEGDMDLPSLQRSSSWQRRQPLPRQSDTAAAQGNRGQMGSKASPSALPRWPLCHHRAEVYIPTTRGTRCLGWFLLPACNAGV